MARPEVKDAPAAVQAAGPGTATAPKKTLQSPLAGTWYAAGAAPLKSELARYLADAKVEPQEKVHALILPHAGYQYSGPTAAYGIKQLAGRKFSRVVVLAPTHRVSLPNQISVPEYTHYVTPLGEATVDTEFLAALRKYPFCRSLARAHDQEHSDQIQLPWLQYQLGDVRWAPIIVGQVDLATAGAIAAALKQLVDRDTLVIASSDFTHYGPRFDYTPFTDDVPENLKKLDLGAYAFIEKKDAKGFLDYCDRTGATICGRCPIAILLALLPPTSTACLLQYDTSGHVTGDYTDSVSYLSVAFTGEWPAVAAGATVAAVAPAPEPKADGKDVLPEADQKALLELARQTLEYYFKNRRPPKAKDLGYEATPATARDAGCFVTLQEDGDLRGCIGNIVARGPLYESVIANALNSALHDGRFPPVTGEEVPKLHLEISVLTPPEPIASWKDIVIGKHGVILEKQGYSAVFLPQVAPEQGWDVEQMLNHLARKAGLPMDAWREGATFEVFEAVVFAEAK